MNIPENEQTNQPCKGSLSSTELCAKLVLNSVDKYTKDNYVNEIISFNIFFLICFLFWQNNEVFRYKYGDYAFHTLGSWRKLKWHLTGIFLDSVAQIHHIYLQATHWMASDLLERCVHLQTEYVGFFVCVRKPFHFIILKLYLTT